jgi:hypothetical protein
MEFPRSRKPEKRAGPWTIEPRIDILLAINREDSDKIPGGFLLHRSASLRRISTGFTSGLARP